MTKGILKNARPDASYKQESPNVVDEEIAKVDRKKVIENTRLNAQISGGVRREQTISSDTSLEPEEQLRWDERNLLVNEMGKSSTMKIDEPKTPYEGGFDPNNDYYRPDEDDNNDELNDVEGLGEGLDDDMEDVQQPNFEVVAAASAPASNSADHEKELDVDNEANKHLEFERRRKMHYKTEANPLHHKIDEDEDELIDEE